MNVDTLRRVLAHPINKRFAVAIPLTVVIGLLRSWFGDHSILIGLFVGGGSYLFADWLLSTKSEREKRIQPTAAFFRDHKVMVAKCVGYLLICAYLLGTLTEPTEPAVKQIFLLVQAFGLLAVFFATMFAAVISCWSGSCVYGLTSFFLRGLALNLFALWLLGQSGDGLYRWLLAHPHDAAIGAVSLIIVWMIIRFSRGLTSWPEGTATRTLTERDIRYTAAHEAGHALAYAALGALPADLKLNINDRSDPNGVLGFVSGTLGEHRLNEKTFAEWLMLVFLAGKMGESALLGETTLDGGGDHTRWLTVARQYLSNHNRGIFYEEPRNEWEHKQNEEKLNALQSDQVAMLTRLFDHNADVFKGLAEALLERRTLDRDAVIPFLARVQLPDGFPLPDGPRQVM